MNKDNVKSNQNTPTLWMRWRKRLLYILLIILISPFFISAILHIPIVQNWAVDNVTTYLSNRMEENVEIDFIDFSMFNGLKLEGFDVYNNNQDTIIGTKSLNVSLGKNILTLLKGELTIITIELIGPRLYLSKEKGDSLTNIQKILKKFSSPKTSSKKSKKKALRINLQEIDILDVTMQFYDKNTESKIDLFSKAIFINVENINIDSNYYRINDLSIKDMELEISRGQVVALEKNDLRTENIPIDTIAEGNPLKLPNITIDRFVLQNGSIKLNSDTQSNKPNFDSKNFHVSGVEISLEDLIFTDKINLLVSINNVAFNDNKGFVLENLKTECVEVNEREVIIPDLILNTEKSYVSTSIKLSYRNYEALKSIATKTLLNSTISRSSIALEDVLHFLPNNNSPFFINNYNKKITVEGDFTGRIANLKGNNVKLSIPGTISAAGNFGTRNLNSKNPLINLRMQSLQTSITGLKNILPKFKPPKNFEKLGTIDFKGNFDGYLNDFVAFGTLRSELGTVKTDMRLDLKNGVDNATYSGDISLNNFDLKKWSGNDDLGYITFSGNIRNGKGLTIKNAYADLSGSLESLQFRNYDYKNININGALDKNKFDGKLSSTDLNLNFGFDGFAEFVDDKITFDFNADVGIVDFQAINLSKDKLAFKGNLDLEGSGSSIDDLVGKLDARNLNIIKGDSTFILDSVVLESAIVGNRKSIDIEFDGSKIEMEGQYEFKSLPDDFQSIIKKNYPYHTKNWPYQIKTISSNQNVDFDLKLKNNKVLFDLIGIPTNFTADTLYAKGSLNSSKEEVSLVTAIPSINLNDNVFKNIFLNFNSKDSVGNINLLVDTSKIAKTVLNKIDLSADINGNEIKFLLNTDQLIDSLQHFEVTGSLKPFRNGYTISLDDNDIRIYNQRWKINADNEINIDKKYIDINNFSITDGTRLIEINDINNKGLRINVSKFDIELINGLIKEDRFYFTGNVFSNIRVADIFQKSPDIYGNILMPNLKINGDSYGELNLDLSKPLNQPLDAILSINNPKNGQAIKFNANVDLDQKRVDADLKAKNVPLKILQYLLYKGISNVEGFADIAGTIRGPFDNLKINTKGMTHDGKVKVLVLGETYSFDKQPFVITESEIDMNGALIYDSQGGEGYITGGLGHTLFKKVYLKASVTGSNVIALNTTKFDNPTYYGLGRGNVSVDFTGDVNYPNILINARTNKGTTINIPIQSTKSASDKSFITFIDKEVYFGEDGDNENNVVKIDGVSLEMNLIMTPEAKVFLIFDEAKGDIIEATGVGNMQINMNRNGDFDIYGDYEIREGEYLFTALSFINKPFKVREGGKVRWNGDPINATIDIEADYLVRTDLSLFLAEYLVTPALEQAASNRTDVNLQMILGNTLYNPTINFGLNFPDLTGDLKSYADSKVRLLGNNQNDLNNQVFGLIVFNSFLPTNTLSQVLASGSVIQSASVNTLSEFFSNQLSSYVTRFINETLEDNGLISGVDFDINLRNNLTFQGVETNEFSIVPTEIEVKLKNRFRFLDGRLSFDLGGNFVRESLTGLNNYVVPEFTFRYALTPDRKLNLKVYGKYDLDEISVTNRRQRLGVGIRYRTEFGSMLETKNLISKSLIQVQSQDN